MLNNVFVCSKNLFSFSRYLDFCLGFLLMQKNRLDQKGKVNFKIYDFTAWKTNNCNTHIAQYLKKSKGNQTMRFGQLIEHTTRKIFLKRSYTKYDGKTIPRPFSKKSNLNISLDQYSKVFVFVVCQVEGYRNVL